MFALTFCSARRYRMHPSISMFPSAHFYEGRLLDDKSVAERPKAGLGPAEARPYMFVDVPHGQEKECAHHARRVLSACGGRRAAGGGAR